MIDKIQSVMILVLTVLAIFVSINFVGLNNDISNKIDIAVSEKLYYENNVAPYEFILTTMFGDLVAEYDTRIWSINHLMEYLYNTNNYTAYNVTKNLNQAYVEIDGENQKINIIKYIMYTLKKRLKENTITNEKSIEGSLWTLYNISKLDKRNEFEILKFIKDISKNYQLVSRQILKMDALKAELN
jgi:hypothetical protein